MHCVAFATCHATLHVSILLKKSHSQGPLSWMISCMTLAKEYYNSLSMQEVRGIWEWGFWQSPKIYGHTLLSAHTIREIETNHREELTHLKLDMTDCWWNSNLDASWDKLAKAMGTIGQSKLGQEIWQIKVGEHYVCGKCVLSFKSLFATGHPHYKVCVISQVTQ